jgi:hypothetical protein
MPDLTDRQAAFVRAFLTPGPPGSAYLCATRSAAAVGYAWPGKQGPRLMTMPHVAAAVEEGFLKLCPVDPFGRPVPPGPCM